MSDTKLVIGMPAGSLANPNRGGNLITLLKHAGFPTKGYDAGGPTSFPLHSMLVGWDGRPQEFGAQLALGNVDIAIGGDDWMRERTLEFKYVYGQDIQLTKVLSLGRGGVRIVVVHNPLANGAAFDDWLRARIAANPLVTMVSEMPFLALGWYHDKLDTLGLDAAALRQYRVQKFQTPPQIDAGLVIYETWGKTEAKVVNGAVDFGLEITQSGSAIRNYGLEIADEIMASESGIWANPAIKQNPEKYELARMFLLNLYGALYAENKVILLFNAKQADEAKILAYLRDNHLFGDEPTMNRGESYTEFSVQMETNNPDLPLARARFELAKLGATAIETIPLESAIPHSGVIDL
ncbi:MAG: hypothetical protein ACLFTT_06760 [Candidatus Hydrogenedentota bacterium]